MLMRYGCRMKRKNTNYIKCIYLITTLFISGFISSLVVIVSYTNRVNFSWHPQCLPPQNLRCLPRISIHIKEIENCLSKGTLEKDCFSSFTCYLLLRIKIEWYCKEVEDRRKVMMWSPIFLRASCGKISQRKRTQRTKTKLINML